MQNIRCLLNDLVALQKKTTYLLPYINCNGDFIGKKISGKTHMNETLTKLVEGHAMLQKLRHFVNKEIFLSEWYAIFQFNIAYFC